MQVPLLDLTTQYNQLREELLAAVTRVLDSQKCVNGPAIAQFEREVADHCRAADAVAVASGTDALLCSLMALGLKEGDQVITTPFTFFATVGSIWRTGAKPVFVDIDPQTFNLDPDQIADAITDRTRAIMPVHLFGQMAAMDPIVAIAKKHDLAVVEDAAQSIGATYHNHPAGTLGTCGCLSFFPSKNLGGLGDGGMIVTQDPALAEQCRILRAHGSKARYYHHVVGGNFRMDTVNAAYLSVKLKHLDAWSQARRNNAAAYDAHFAHVEAVTTPRIAAENVSIYNQYVIRVDRRDQLQNYLAEHNIGTAIYYPLCLHEQDCFKDLGYQRGDFPHAEQAAKEVLALPIYPELNQAQIDYVAQTVKQFYQ